MTRAYPALFKSLRPKPRHHPGHFERGLGRLRAAIVFRAETADARVLHFFKKEHPVDDRQPVLHLNLRQRMR